MTTTRSSSRRRFAATALGAVGAAAVLLACTLTQSLDYLTKGEGAADVVTEEPTPPQPEGGRVPTPLLTNLTKPGLLAQDTDALYWVAGGGVFSAPKTGGTPKMLGMAPAATSLVVEPEAAGALFLSVGTDVVRLAKNGSGGGAVFKPEAGAPLADTLALGDTALFVLQYDNAIPESYLLRMAKDGGAPVNMSADSGPTLMTTDTKSLLWLDPAEGTGVFYDLAKSAAPGSPGKRLPLAMEDDSPVASENVTADDTSLYWVTDGAIGVPGIFSRKRETAAPVIAVFRGKMEKFGAIAVDATHVYAIETTAGAILRVPKQGGVTETLLTGLVVPRGLVVDATSYYVSVENTGPMGVILKMKK